MFLDYAAAFAQVISPKAYLPAYSAPNSFPKIIVCLRITCLSLADCYCFGYELGFRLTRSSMRVGAVAFSHLQPLKTALHVLPKPNSKSNSSSLIMSANSSLDSNSKTTSPAKLRWRLGRYFRMFPFEARMTGTALRLFSMLNFQSVTRSSTVESFLT